MGGAWWPGERPFPGREGYERIIPILQTVRGTAIMPATTKRTFSLPDEQSHYIDSLVASGTYATGS